MQVQGDRQDPRYQQHRKVLLVQSMISKFLKQGKKRFVKSSHDQNAERQLPKQTPKNNRPVRKERHIKEVGENVRFLISRMEDLMSNEPIKVDANIKAKDMPSYVYNCLPVQIRIELNNTGVSLSRLRRVAITLNRTDNRAVTSKTERIPKAPENPRDKRPEKSNLQVQLENSKNMFQKRSKKIHTKPRGESGFDQPSGKPVNPELGWQEEMTNKLKKDGFYLPVDQAQRGFHLSGLEDVDYNSAVCHAGSQCYNLINLVRRSEPVERILGICRGQGMKLIAPNYVDNVLYTYQKSFGCVIRKNLLSGKLDKLPTLEQLTRVIVDAKQRGHFFSPVYTNKKYTVFEPCVLGDIKEGDATFKTLPGDLTYLDLPMGKRIYFANGQEQYVPNELIDAVCTKMAYTKVTPTILNTIKYYGRKYASDLGYKLNLDDLNLLVKIVLNKTQETNMLASIIYNGRFEKYNELLDFKLSDKVSPVTEKDVINGIDNLAKSFNIRETCEDTTTSVSVKKIKLSSLKCATFGDVVNTLKNSWKDVISGKFSVDIPFGWGRDIQLWIESARSVYQKNSSMLHTEGLSLVSKLSLWGSTFVSLAKEGLEPVLNGISVNQEEDGGLLGGLDF